MPIYKTDVVQHPEQVYEPATGGQVFVREATYENSRILAALDVLEMIPVFAGEKVVGLQVFCERQLADDGTIDVGDGANADRYIDASGLGAEGGLVEYGSGAGATETEARALNHVYADDDTLDILLGVVTTPTAAADGAAKIMLRAFLVKP